MTKKDEWVKKQQAEDAGYNPKPWEGLQIHSDPTANPARRRHEFCKFVIALVLDEKGRQWSSETTMADGRVDIFDMGPKDGRAVVYEVETAYSENKVTDKVDQYCKGPVRDVLVVNPSSVPDNLFDAVEYIENEVIIG